MKAKSVTKAIFLVLVLGFSSCTEHQKARHKEKNIIVPAEKTLQEAGVRKDTLYFLWENYEEYNEYTNKVETIKPYRSDSKQGLAFAFPNGEYFLFEDGSISEKLKIKLYILNHS